MSELGWASLYALAGALLFWWEVRTRKRERRQAQRDRIRRAERHRIITVYVADWRDAWNVLDDQACDRIRAERDEMHP